MGKSERHDAPARRRILVVDDSEALRTLVAQRLTAQGYEVDTAESGRRARALLDAGLAPDVVLLDVLMPGESGLQTLAALRETHPGLPVVMLSVDGTAATIVEAMRLGAVDYLAKPVDDELEAVLEQVFQRPAAGEDALQRDSEEAFWGGVALQRVRATLDQVSETDVSVLLQGESGVGKEVVARAVHATSSRRAGPFVKVNCAALPGELLESELFGYEKGAFTGANSRKLGRFEVAHRGTIFLDEIGEMSPQAQAKLLHVLQDGRFSRLGSNREVAVDVRLVSATNRPIEQMIQERRFREDLFFRLNVVAVRIPPLRERRAEVAPLADFFLERFSRRYGRPRPRLSQRLVKALASHPFPGNVRELENLIKRVVILGSEEAVVNDLASRASAGSDPRAGLEALLESVEESAGRVPLREVGRLASQHAERALIERTLLLTGWNRKRAARLLGISYKTLLTKIRECALEPD